MTARDLLRALPVFDRDLPDFEPATAPDEPVALFVRWLSQAIDAKVTEPQVMTLCTVDARGHPDARALIVRDVSDDGWQFTTSLSSAKGTQLAANPHAALHVYWREQGRQVRVRGQVRVAPRAVSAADFLAQSPGARVAGLVGRESTVLDDPAALPRAMEAARRRLAEDPVAVAPDHAVCVLVPQQVEFWQGDHRRQHVRLRYRRRGDGAWLTERLWP